MWMWFVGNMFSNVLAVLQFCARCSCCDVAIRPAIARGVVEVDRDPRLPGRLIVRVADPVSGRPGIDVQVLLVAVPVLYGVRSTRITHLTKLLDHFVDRIEVALAHFDPVTDDYDGSGSSVSPSQDPAPGCRLSLPVGVEDIVRFDQESRHRLDLVVENDTCRRLYSRCRY